MTSTTWTEYHRRAAALKDVLATIEANPGNDLPWPDIAAETFKDEADLLVALHDLWTRRLEMRIDLFLETDDNALGTSVGNAWHAVASELPGLRDLLDRYADHPAVQHHELSEHRLVAVAAGLATLGDPVTRTAQAGRAFVAKVRQAGPPALRKPLSLGQRLREVLSV
ncbi:MAG TPA: hypothetical protein VLI04_10730 [Nocardioidaceae bacterium]|nr:hypothetical protein [Nocardioidaceae bacterium]